MLRVTIEIMYRAFDDPKYIEKMVRRIVVFLEESTLKMTFLIDDPDVDFELENEYSSWVKYVSTNSGIPHEVDLLWDSKIENALLNELSNKVEADDDYLFRMDKRFLDAYNNFAKATDCIFQIKAEDLIKMTNEELIKLLNFFFFYGEKALLAYYIPYDFIGVLVKMIKKKIIKKNLVKDKDVDEELKILSLDGVDTVLHTERKNFLESLIFIQQSFKKDENIWHNKIVKDIIYQQWYKFGAMTYVHGAEHDYSYEDYLAKFRENMNLKAKKELKELNDELNKGYKNYLRTIRKYSDDHKLLTQIKWLRKMMQYRNKEAEYYDMYFDHCMNLFKEIAKRLKIATSNLWLLSKSEIIKGLKNKDVQFIKKIVNERIKCGFTIKQKGKEIVVYTGVKEEDRFVEEIKEADLIKGQITFSGLVKGKAKIIFNPFHQGKYFEDGDILVTSMTTPDFVPLMKKAKAVITDEGGILCHAAIVSRELEKPCIIGTKNATKILRDGDKIEVNAKEGIVKILQKHFKEQLTQHLVKHSTI